MHQKHDMITLAVAPNKSNGSGNTITVRPTIRGTPVHGARVYLTLTMLTMSMGSERFRLKEVHRAVYRYSGPGLVMSGTWRLQVSVDTSAGRKLSATVQDVVHS